MILSFIYPIYKHNWKNISTIYIFNKTSIKRNILTIKQNTSGSIRAKDLSAPLYTAGILNTTAEGSSKISVNITKSRHTT